MPITEHPAIEAFRRTAAQASLTDAFRTLLRDPDVAPYIRNPAHTGYDPLKMATNIAEHPGNPHFFLPIVMALYPADAHVVLRRIPGDATTAFIVDAAVDGLKALLETVPPSQPS